MNSITYRLLLEKAFVRIYFNDSYRILHCHVLGNFTPELSYELNTCIMEQMFATRAKGVLMDLTGLHDFEAYPLDDQTINQVKPELERIAYFASSITLQMPGVRHIIQLFSKWYPVECFTKFSRQKNGYATNNLYHRGRNLLSYRYLS